MADTGTHWTWELQKLQAQITHDATQAIDVWHQRWRGILDQEAMHAREAGKESTLVPSAEPWGQSKQAWTEKPLEEKTADLREMVSNLGKRVERMITNRDSDTMDAGWYLGVALSVHAAEVRRLAESPQPQQFERQELAFDESQLRIAAQEPMSAADVGRGDVVIDTTKPEMEGDFQALLAKLDQRIDALVQKAEAEIHQLQQQRTRY